MLGIHHHRYRLAVIACSQVESATVSSTSDQPQSAWGPSFVCGAVNAAYDEFSWTYSAATAEFVTCRDGGGEGEGQLHGLHVVGIEDQMRCHCSSAIEEKALQE